MAEIKEWQTHKGLLLDSVNGYDVIECEGCGFKHIVPIPNPEELESTYRLEYYDKEKPLYLERHKEDLDWWNLVYSDRYDTFEEILPPSSRRILDVGSGPGFFLLHGKERGWQTMGIEPSAQAADHSRKLGLDIIEGFFTEELIHSLGKFDVIHMSEVLEHTAAPLNILLTARSILKDDGLLCIIVPNDYNPFQIALRIACGYEPWWIAPPHHINYFDFNSLRLLLKNNGFRIVSCEATFPIDMFLLMGDNYIDNDTLGRQCHAKRKGMERNLTKAKMTNLKRELYRAFSSIGVGREAQVIGQKTSG
ncbi:class I SAM-dependent methyltransferase [bacterium]|nr:class I SAM-dependent methyltransferase [bacterium]